MPFFSVVIPLYNKEKFVENTLKSVLNQSFKDFEIIIIDDGSSDNSFNIVKRINDSRIKLFSHENHGLSFSRNCGIKKAKANYIAFMDADDLWQIDFLSSIFKLITIYTDLHVFATNYSSFYKDQEPNLNSEAINDNELIDNYFERCKNVYASSSLVCHKSVFETIGYFNENVNYGEEEDFAIRCFLQYNLAYCKTIKAYRLDGIENQLTAPSPNSNRVIPDYDIYLNDHSNKNLEKYIHFIHLKLLVLYKMERNYGLVKFYKEKINISNLTLAQRIKYYLPTDLFYITKSIYIWFSNSLIHS